MMEDKVYGAYVTVRFKIKDLITAADLKNRFDNDITDCVKDLLKDDNIISYVEDDYEIQSIKRFVDKEE